MNRVKEERRVLTGGWWGKCSANPTNTHSRKISSSSCPDRVWTRATSQLVAVAVDR